MSYTCGATRSRLPQAVARAATINEISVMRAGRVKSDAVFQPAFNLMIGSRIDPALSRNPIDDCFARMASLHLSPRHEPRTSDTEFSWRSSVGAGVRRIEDAVAPDRRRG